MNRYCSYFNPKNMKTLQSFSLLIWCLQKWKEVETWGDLIKKGIAIICYLIFCYYLSWWAGLFYMTHENGTFKVGKELHFDFVFKSCTVSKPPQSADYQFANPVNLQLACWRTFEFCSSPFTNIYKPRHLCFSQFMVQFC